MQKGNGEAWAAPNNPFERGGGSGGEFVSLSLSLSLHRHSSTRSHRRQRKPFLLQLPSHRKLPPTTPQRSQHPFCSCRHRHSRSQAFNLHTLLCSLFFLSFLTLILQNRANYSRRKLFELGKKIHIFFPVRRRC